MSTTEMNKFHNGMCGQCLTVNDINTRQKNKQTTKKTEWLNLFPDCMQTILHNGAFN